MQGGTKNCPKGRNRICVPINRKAEVLKLLSNPPTKSVKSRQGTPPELGAFRKVLNQVRQEHPNLSYREAQKLASQVYKLASDPNGNLIFDDSIEEPASFDDGYESASFDSNLSRTFDDSIVESIIEKIPVAIPETFRINSSDLDTLSSLDTLSGLDLSPGDSISDVDLFANDANSVELSTVESVAKEINLLGDLTKASSDIPNFREKAKAIEESIEDFYEVTFNEPINLKEVFEDVPKNEVKSLWESLLDITSELLDVYDNREQLTNEDLQKTLIPEKTDAFQKMLAEMSQPNYLDGSDDFGFLSGEGFGKLKHLVNRIRKHKHKKIRGGDSGSMVESTEETLKYLNSGYNGLVDIMENVISHVYSLQTLDIPACAKLYNVLLELEDAYETFEGVLEQVEDNDEPANYMCALYEAVHRLPEYIKRVKNTLGRMERAYPDLMDKIGEYIHHNIHYNKNGILWYEPGSLGEVRGGGYWGQTAKYAPNYYGHR